MLCLNQFSWQWLLRLVGSLVYLIQLLNLVLGLNKLNSSPITLMTTTFIKVLHTINCAFLIQNCEKGKFFVTPCATIQEHNQGWGWGRGFKDILLYILFENPPGICRLFYFTPKPIFQIKLNQTPGNSTKLCYTPRKI